MLRAWGVYWPLRSMPGQRRHEYVLRNVGQALTNAAPRWPAVARALLNQALNAAIVDTQRLGNLNGRRTVSERCGGAQRQRSLVHRVSPPTNTDV